MHLHSSSEGRGWECWCKELECYHCDANVKRDSMFRCKDLKILVLVPSPAAAAQVTRCRLLHLSVHPVPGRESTACSSTALRGLQNTEICPDWKVKTLPVFHCKQNLCAATQPPSGPCVVKKCLTWFCQAQTEETCPSREGRHGTAPWERASGRTVQEETGSVVGALGGSPMLQPAGALGRAGPWGWDYSAGALAYSGSCLSILAIAWWREKYFRQKGKRNNQETIIVGSYIYVHPAGLPWRRHLQCLQGWPLSSVWFLIPHPTLSPGFQLCVPVAQTRAHQHSRRMDGQHFGPKCEIKPRLT